MPLLERIPFRLLLILLVAATFSGVPRPVSASPLVYLPGFPTLRQQHTLTCESSAASMATRAAVSEGQIMSVMPRSADPNLGFRGNPDGEQGAALVDYGVYAQPIQRALTHFGYRSKILSYANDASLKAYIRRGWPVLLWITYKLQPAAPRLARANGIQFFLVPHEHALLLVGYDNHTIIANDPWIAGQVRYYWRDFNRSWGYFGNMALAIEPCPLAQPVGNIHAALSDAGIDWTWDRARNAARYNVTVTRIGKKAERVVYQGSLNGTQFTLASPSLAVQYEIAVQAVTSCGGVTGTRRLVFQMPAAPLTATPVPEKTVPVVPSPAPTATSTPLATATPTPTSTP